jgi:hypothetical protein
MHATTFIQKTFKDVIHTKRLNLIAELVQTVITSKELSLSKLGRAIEGKAQEKSQILKVDRFLGNAYYQKYATVIYQGLINTVIGSTQRPWLIVDWSKVPNTNYYVLRAARIAEGRALTIYEEIHPKAKEGNPIVHKEFLKRLHAMLPAKCCPIIITDAGFKNPWFKVVLKLGWDYIGRVRGKTKYKDGNAYKTLNHLSKSARQTPRYVGEKILSKKNPLKAHFYLCRHELVGRKRYTCKGQVSQHKDSKAYSKGYREPWILVSSLKGYNMAKRIVEIYKKRMTIEEGFRDMKSSRYGFGMEHNKTLKPERLIVWFLLATLASLIAWLTGYAGELKGIHLQFQANTIKSRRVLSFFYLGCQMIRKKMKIPIDINKVEFMDREWAL